MKVLNGINHCGLRLVWFAEQGIAPSWRMKRDMLSPTYTTCLQYIPIARLSKMSSFKGVGCARRS
uniref:DUF4113 domain-containing protein n=1 Tax=Atlantibacter hermannii TaxID=565 RepID=UPI0035E4523A